MKPYPLTFGDILTARAVAYLRQRNQRAMTTFPLYIPIKGKLYGVLGLERGCWRLHKLDETMEPTGDEYTITEGDYGFRCDCGDFEFKREARGEACKHISAGIRARLLIPRKEWGREPIRSHA